MTTASSSLATLRRDLAALGAARARVRVSAAWSAVATAAIAGILAFWALDVAFEMSVLQRLLMLALLVGVVAWTFQRLARPWLGIAESEMELALRVERAQRIDSDLVAALQFEDPRAREWGSTQLESAVIAHVAGWGSRFNVFDGFDTSLLRRRATWLGIVATLWLGLSLLFPGHAGALFNRLFLGHRHYPTRTTIEQIIVNQQAVLSRPDDGTTPRGARAAQAHPVRFWVQCAGALPADAHLRLTGDSTQAQRRIELTRVTLEQRHERLVAIQRQTRRIAAGEEPSPSGERLAELLATLRIDAREAHAAWPGEAQGEGQWSEVVSRLDQVLASWPGDAERQVVFQGELGRLVDSVSYKLYAGDAWTDPATVSMIPLPVVQPVVDVQPPDYSVAAAEPVDVAARQLAVLEGSRVEVGLKSTNRKPLAAAWLAWQTPQGPQNLPLEPVDAEKLAWRLPTAGSPFASLRQETRFELQVRDTDSLQLETPIGMVLRIKADRPPTASVDIVHKVVLPTAKPKIEYRANDDYGISQIVLHVEIEPGQNEAAARGPAGVATDAPKGTSDGTPGSVEENVALRRRSIPLLPTGRILGRADLPRLQSHELELQPFGLTKGDRLKLTLEVVDHRGASEGESVVSDPLYLEISDESGVLAAILEADEKSEQRLNEIIKRQLGIGESP